MKMINNIKKAKIRLPLVQVPEQGGHALHGGKSCGRNAIRHPRLNRGTFDSSGAAAIRQRYGWVFIFAIERRTCPIRKVMIQRLDGLKGRSVPRKLASFFSHDLLFAFPVG